jgi:hypothetical protein
LVGDATAGIQAVGGYQGLTRTVFQAAVTMTATESSGRCRAKVGDRLPGRCFKGADGQVENQGSDEYPASVFGVDEQAVPTDESEPTADSPGSFQQWSRIGERPAICLRKVCPDSGQYLVESFFDLIVVIQSLGKAGDSSEGRGLGGRGIRSQEDPDGCCFFYEQSGVAAHGHVAGKVVHLTVITGLEVGFQPDLFFG